MCQYNSCFENNHQELSFVSYFTWHRSSKTSNHQIRLSTLKSHRCFWYIPFTSTGWLLVYNEMINECPRNKHKLQIWQGSSIPPTDEQMKQMPNTPSTSWKKKLLMEAVRCPCILLYYHTIPPESSTTSTALMSKPWRSIFSFHEQGKKLGETGLEVNMPIIFLLPVSANRADWTGERENMLHLAKDQQHTPHLCNATAQGKYDSEDCLSHNFFLSSFWSGKAVLSHSKNGTSKAPISSSILKCVREIKSTNFARDSNTWFSTHHYFTLQ